jgi:arylsulfatase A
MGKPTLTALIVAASIATVKAEERPPNIILILADDLGIGHVGCYGQRKIATPKIDRLAAEGMKFTQFYSGACVCAPSRSVLMTGRHTGHTAVRNNGLDRYLNKEDVTVAEVLKSAGYATGGFGKWGLGRESTPGVAVRQGFDEWFGQYSQVHAHFHYPAFLMHNLDRFPLPENEGRRRGRYAPDVIHERALAFIREHRDRPFFAYLAYTLPHVELTVPAASRRPYEGRWPKIARDDPRPGYLGSDNAYAEFAGMVSHLDRQVGEVLALVKELDLDRRTIVLFSSDNGPQPGAFADIFVEFFDGNGPFRDAKESYYEGGIRVPFLARWPGVIRAGSVSDHVGSFADILPTLAELAGAARALPEHDGISFVPTLRGQLDRQRNHPYLYWELDGEHQDIEQQAVRWGDWKAVRPRAHAAWELYDLATDPAEAHNVAAERPKVLQRIETFAAEAHQPERTYGPTPNEGVADYVR